MKNPTRPRDANQLGKLIVDLATGAITEKTLADHRNPAAVALGKLGGMKGGHARAKALTAKERSAIAKQGAKARWKKNQK